MRPDVVTPSWAEAAPLLDVRDERLREVDWDEWFATFDQCRLNFIYQEERSDGRQSNFFRLESPDREDG